MFYKMNLKSILLILKPLWIWVVAYILVLLFQENNFFQHSKGVFGIILLFLLFPYYLLFIQYLFFSFSKIQITDGNIIINNISYEKAQIQKIIMISSENRNVKQNSYNFPWMAGNFYYFKIKLSNNKLYFLTCFMDKGKGFEIDLKRLEIEYDFRFLFIPLISR
jgi:hypothetical protein